jgi:segregation and condensation protein A
MITKEGYTIHLPVYEGPLDLLLELIEQAELDITKIALAQVTDQYLSYLKQIPEYHLEDLTSFLIVAARLLQIKSEALLPRPPEREPGEEDPGDALARQLIAYKKYKEVAALLADREGAGLKTYLRLGTPLMPEPKLDLLGATVEDLRQAFQDALLAVNVKPSFDDVVQIPRVRIRDRIAVIIQALRDLGRTTFSHVLKSTKTRLEIVVSFLAMLELIKQHQIQASQEITFGEIEITPGESWEGGQDMEFDLEFEE